MVAVGHEESDGTVAGPATGPRTTTAPRLMSGARASPGSVIVTPEGTKIWLDENNERHRDNGPALVRTNGDKHWYDHGERHHDDGPAVDSASGKEWYRNG
jgi:hypothetical protein